MLPTILLMMAQADAASSPVAFHSKILNAETIVDYTDYPIESLRREEYGVVSIRLRVAANGKVTACDVTETSGHRALDEKTCLLYRGHARFDPARTINGAAVSDEFRAVTAWGVGEHQPNARINMPMQVSRLPADYRMPLKARVISDAAGNIVACDVMESSGSKATDRAACAYVSRTLVLPIPKSRSAEVPPAAVRYLTATLTASPPPPSSTP